MNSRREQDEQAHVGRGDDGRRAQSAGREQGELAGELARSDARNASTVDEHVGVAVDHDEAFLRVLALTAQHPPGPHVDRVQRVATSRR